MAMIITTSLLASEYKYICSSKTEQIKSHKTLLVQKTDIAAFTNPKWLSAIPAEYEQIRGNGKA